MNIRYASLLVRNGQDAYALVDDGRWSQASGALFLVTESHNRAKPRAGQMARLAARTIYDTYYANPAADRLSVLREAIDRAQAEMIAASPTAEADCVAVLAHQGLLFIVNIGATRVYTLDLSGVFVHTGQGQLNGRLGATAVPNVETWIHTLEQVVLMLGTRGFYQAIPDAEVKAAMRGTRQPEDITLRLLARWIARPEPGETEGAAAIVILAGKNVFDPSSFGDEDAVVQREPRPRGPQGTLDAHAQATAQDDTMPIVARTGGARFTQEPDNA